MKKLIIAAIFISCIQIAQAQSKEELVDKTQLETSWIVGEMISQCITINATTEQWTKLMQRSNNYGIDAFESTGRDLVYYADAVLGTTFQKTCGLSTSIKSIGNKLPECTAQMNEKVKGNISITLNLSNIKFTEIGQKMAIGSMQAVGDFLDAGSGDILGVKGGWRPKGKSLSIIMNMENNSGATIVKWNADGTVATITVHTATESPRWRDAIINGLAKGGVKTQ